MESAATCTSRHYMNYVNAVKVSKPLVLTLSLVRQTAQLLIPLVNLLIKPEPAEQLVMLSEEEECLLEEHVQELEKKKWVADLLLHERWLEEELGNLVVGIENKQSGGRSPNRGTLRHCNRRDRSSSSTSSENTSSRDHRKKRKWNIRKYIEDNY